LPKQNTIQEINMCYLNKLTVDFRSLHKLYHE